MKWKERWQNRKRISIYQELLFLLLAATFAAVAAGFGTYYLGRRNSWLVEVTEDYSDARKNCDMQVMEMQHNFDKNVLGIMQAQTEGIEEEDYHYYNGDKIFWGNVMNKLIELYETPFGRIDEEEYSGQQMRILITDYSGTVLWKNVDDNDTEQETEKMRQALLNERVEIYEIMQKSYEDNDGDYFFVCSKNLDYFMYYIVFQMPLQPEYIYHYEKLWIASVLIGTVIFVLLVLMGVRSKIQYMVYMSAVVGEIARGNLDTPIEINGHDEFSNVALSIDEMQKRLSEKIGEERRNERKVRELITNLSHDIKTPMTIITGYLDMVSSKRYENEEQKDEYIQKAYTQVQKINNMILKIFQLAKEGIYSEEMKLVNVNLSRLLKQEIAEYELTAEEQNRKLTLISPKEPVFMELAVEEFKVALDNVIMNSIKYSLMGTEIETVLCEEEHSVLITVSNKAKALKEYELRDIFEKFYRADPARNSVIDGNGIGLAIVKQIVEKHNGRVWAEYNGDTFYLKIRLQRGTQKEGGNGEWQ